MICEKCYHNEVCKYGENRSNGLYCTGERCKQYKSAALVVELPCTVGDMVYMPWEWNGEKGIACLEVTTMSNIIGFGWSFGTDFDTDDEEYADEYKCGRFEFDDIGKTVFLTREAAEAAVEERRSKHDNS